MDLMPAIDLQDGECVRLFQGKKDKSTQYSDDPLGMARHWQQEGAKRLHIVDLDGAFEEESANRSVIEGILRDLSIPCQVGGGIRSSEAVDSLLSAGADAVIIGTAGIKNPDLLSTLVDQFGDNRVFAGVDCREGHVLVRGWKEESQYQRDEWVNKLEKIGLGTLVYTEVDRDGTEEGPGITGTRELLEKSSLDIIASGGVGSLDHLNELKKIETDTLRGVIVGRALYEDRFTVSEAQRILSTES